MSEHFLYSNKGFEISANLGLDPLAGVLALTAGVHGFLVVEAGETTSDTTTSSFHREERDQSLVTEWWQGRMGGVCIGRECRLCRVGHCDEWDYIWLMVVEQKIKSKDLLLMILYYGEKWYMLSFIETLSV
jgi:hypothetical protein